MLPPHYASLDVVEQGAANTAERQVVVQDRAERLAVRVDQAGRLELRDRHGVGVASAVRQAGQRARAVRAGDADRRAALVCPDRDRETRRVLGLP